MRALLYWTGATIVAAATIVAGCLSTIAFLVVAFMLLTIWGGVLWAVLWLMFGLAVVSIAFDLLRLPFLLLGAALMAVSGYDPEQP